MATKGKGKKFAWPSAPGKKVHTRSWEDEQKRVKTAKLNAPIVPGSSITERALASAANAATATRYAPLEREQGISLAQAQSQQRDFGGAGGFYDQYLAQIAQHAANVNAIAGQASQAVQGLQQGVAGIAGADLSQLQGQANQLAAQRGMPGAPAGDLTGMANQAAAVRQALVGSFGAQQAAVNQASQNYAGNLANVVAPGQKLTGQASLARGVTKARGDIAATAREKGAFTEQYKAEQRAEEAKNVTALSIATGKQAGEAAALAETTRSHKADEATDRARIRATERAADKRIQAAIDKSNADATAKGATPNKYGITADRWNAMGESDRQKIIRDYDAGRGVFAGRKSGSGSGSGGSGPDWLTPGQAGAGLSQLANIERLTRKAMKGEPFVAGHGPMPKRDRYAAAQKVLEFAPEIKDPALVRAVGDKIVDKHLSAYTVKQLIAAGYQPSRVAAALGIPTHGQWLKTPAGRAWARSRQAPGPAQTRANTRAYGRSPGGNLGQTNHQ